MHHNNLKRYMPYRKACFLVIIPFIAFSCLKNQDDTASGPKANVSMTNLVLNADSLNVFFNGNRVSPVNFSFANTTDNNGNAYLPLPAGIHVFQVYAGSNLLLEKLLPLEPGRKYSLFFYDSLKNSKLRTVVLSDDTTTIDTLAKARLLHFIPGGDTLTFLFIKDTTVTSRVTTYYGNTSDPGTQIPFGLILRPGTYRIQLKRRNVIIAEQASFEMRGRKLYSFIARGATNGNGSYKESIVVVQHN